MQVSENASDIDSFWEYIDPAGSEERFRAAMSSAQGDERLELLTQIARTYGLRRRFDEAHKVLDEVEKQLADAGPRPHVRYLLERGRAFNSSGEEEKARALFIEAWEQAQAIRQEGLAVDAAHMVAITYASTPDAIAVESTRASHSTRISGPQSTCVDPGHAQQRRVGPARYGSLWGSFAVV